MALRPARAARGIIWSCSLSLLVRPLAGVAAAPGNGAGLAWRDTVVVTIGVLDGDVRQVFGRLRAVSLGRGQDVFLLDDQARTVSWFDLDGRYRGRAGRAGDGPGEFRAPRAIAVDSTGLVHVLDESHRRISAFRPSDSGLVFLRDVRIPMPNATDLCMLGSHYYVLAPHADGVIHEVDQTGSVVRSFGVQIEADAPPALERWRALLTHMSNRGRILCHAESGLVVWLPEASPVVRAFDLAGNEHWRTALQEYRTRGYEASPSGGFRMTADPVTHTAHTGLAVASRGANLVITLQESGLQDPQGTLEWRVLSVADGRERARMPATGTFAGARGEAVLTYRNEPFPQVTIRRPPE